MNIIKFLRKPHLSIILASLILFASCSQYDDTVINSEPVNKNERILSDKQIEKIGELHNENLRNAIKMINSSNQKGENLSVKDAMINLEIKDLTIEQKEFLYKKHSTFDIKTKKAEYENISDYIDMIDEIFNNFKHHNEIVSGFKVIKQKAQKELVGQELENVLILLSIGENSTKFWLSEKDGGEGLGYAFLNKNDYLQKSQMKKRSANEIFWHDMFGGLEGAIGWALGIAIAGGPVTLIPYLVSIGFGAAVSSIKAAM